jgi:hypothetical protein
MSSFICSNAHFNSIEKAINKRRLNNPMDCLNTFDSYNDAGVTQIVDTWFNLNCEAVSLQYGDELVKTNRVRTTPIKELSDVGLYKALCCLHYQIELEHILAVRSLTEFETKAYELMEKATNEISGNIVYKHPEYRDSAWSID